MRKLAAIFISIFSFTSCAGAAESMKKTALVTTEIQLPSGINRKVLGFEGYLVFINSKDLSKSVTRLMKPTSTIIYTYNIEQNQIVDSLYLGTSFVHTFTQKLNDSLFAFGCIDSNSVKNRDFQISNGVLTCLRPL